jgi:hypothetical protein
MILSSTCRWVHFLRCPIPTLSRLPSLPARHGKVMTGPCAYSQLRDGLSARRTQKGPTDVLDEVQQDLPVAQISHGSTWFTITYKINNTIIIQYDSKPPSQPMGIHYTHTHVAIFYQSLSVLQFCQSSLIFIAVLVSGHIWSLACKLHFLDELTAKITLNSGGRWPKMTQKVEDMETLGWTGPVSSSFLFWTLRISSLTCQRTAHILT